MHVLAVIQVYTEVPQAVGVSEAEVTAAIVATVATIVGALIVIPISILCNKNQQNTSSGVPTTISLPSGRGASPRVTSSGPSATTSGSLTLPLGVAPNGNKGGRVGVQANAEKSYRHSLTHSLTHSLRNNSRTHAPVHDTRTQPPAHPNPRTHARSHPRMHAATYPCT